MISHDELLNLDPAAWRTRVKSGLPYIPTDDFMSCIFAAQEKMKAFNSKTITEWAAATEILKSLLGRLGRDSYTVPPIFVDVGFNIEIGDDSFINTNVTLLDSYPIIIGNEVQVGPNCAFYPVGHPLRVAERRVTTPDGSNIHVTTGAPIVVEDRAWIGGNVVVLPGVTIGARSVIGAGSVVTKSIPPDVFAAGNPCRVIKPIGN